MPVEWNAILAQSTKSGTKDQLEFTEVEMSIQERLTLSGEESGFPKESSCLDNFHIARQK